MAINSIVIKALLQLKGLDTATAAKLTHVPLDNLNHWLHDDSPENDDSIPFRVQGELLSLLGVNESGPRNDVVHYWQIYEPFFSTSSKTYASLQTVLRAFGPAQAAFIAPESDPMLATGAKAHFALKFINFLAVLEVTAHPLKSISFNPGVMLMPEVSWAPGSLGILLSTEDYHRLEPGSLLVKGLTDRLTYSTEVNQWASLRDKALENGISAEQVATLLLGANPGLAKIASKPPSAVSKPNPPLTPKVVEPQVVPDMFSEPVTGL